MNVLLLKSQQVCVSYLIIVLFFTGYFPHNLIKTVKILWTTITTDKEIYESVFKIIEVYYFLYKLFERMNCSE